MQYDNTAVGTINKKRKLPSFMTALARYIYTEHSCCCLRMQFAALRCAHGPSAYRTDQPSKNGATKQQSPGSRISPSIESDAKVKRVKKEPRQSKLPLKPCGRPAKASKAHR